MKLLNYIYSNEKSLSEFIQNNKIFDSNSTFIQLFFSNTDSEKVYKIRDEIGSLLPQSSLIGTSTAGMVSNGDIIDDYVLVSFSLFESSTTKSVGYKNLDLSVILDDISQNLILNNTKLLVIFANTYSFASSKLLNALSEKFPNIVLAGGNAGDDFRFQKCETFSGTTNDSDVVITAINSDTLNVKTKYLLNYQSVGQDMLVTSSKDNVVCEINGKNILEIYKHYLGVEIKNNEIKALIDFPLVFEQEGVYVARAPIAIGENNSLIFAGDIKEGKKVKFAYADIDYIEKYNQNHLLAETPYYSEGIYVYTCGARRSNIDSYLNNELSIIEKIAPTSGFVTYGEFFHDGKSCSNALLNITTTYVVLDENSINKKAIVNTTAQTEIKKDTTLKALSMLLKRTSEDLNENLSYLNQFKKAINEASIISVTNAKGIITDVNQNFTELSGYSKEELIGKPHNLVRHDDVPKETYDELWSTIRDKKIWKGVIKNRRKDGSAYTVVSEIAPIYNTDGSFKEYIGIRNDITELEEYKLLLRDELELSNRSLEENINYARQYEEAINSMVYIIKTDVDGIINFVNEEFSKISGYSLDELIGKHCSILRDTKHIKNDDCSEIADRIKMKENVKSLFVNCTKSGEKFTVDVLFYPVLGVNNEVVEILHVMHDVSEIVDLNEDIIGTQREVVATMGAIGETRSKETGQHVKRVAEYSYLLAILYGLSEEEASLLKQASPMHDIGKVGIADSILNKPGKLTYDEFEIMKTHAELGYEMLRHSKRPILNASSIVARTHHEKWDGSGYPMGLTAHSIPIFGRITAVADVFDALGHDRVYKKAWPLEDILTLFKNESAKHFDPKLISLFLSHLDEFLKIRDNMKDSF